MKYEEPLLKNLFKEFEKCKNSLITMATIRSYTTIEQSRKLAEILPLESSDMYWDLLSKDKYAEVNNIGHCLGRYCVYAWSLAALLSVLPTIDDRNAVLCKDIRCDKWHIFYHGTATLPLIDTERHPNAVDACVELIIKLHEQKLL